MRTEELKNNNFYPFFTNHYQWPVAHLLAYAHRPYQLIQHLNHFMRTQKLKNETIYIPFLTNHQQQPAAYHLAYAHRPHQLIQILAFICTSSKEIIQQILSKRKLFKAPFLSLQTISSGQSRIIQRTPTGLTNLSKYSYSFVRAAKK